MRHTKRTKKLRFQKPRRTGWLALRCLPAEKESIRSAAYAREMGMSEYVLWLHQCAIGAGKPDA